MYTASPYPQTAPMRRPNWFARSAAWLDERGKPAWIVAMVLGFIFVWPVGLALLAYMIFGKRMFSGGGCASRRTHHPRRSTGNNAFDAYKADTLRRLEDEQASFEQFLERLRDAKDKAEFDQFMNERANSREDDDEGEETTPNGQPA